NGPCGETGANGSCPFDPKKECIFLRQMRLVKELRSYPALEENVIPGGKQEQP
ncbi:MAG: methylenetetrahydrofolate reductase C-terminal domain-containing protein, partial [Lentisphaeria bacterium]|nr:methylenetetrahydrofolate reductase C-terminal domain-containing protein [Lentisphaeria bacterium]